MSTVNSPLNPNENQRRSEFNKFVLGGAYIGAAAGAGLSLVSIVSASRYFPKFAQQPLQLKALIMTFSTAAGFAFGGEKALFYTPHSTFYKYFERQADLAQPNNQSLHSDSFLKNFTTTFQNNKKTIFATVGFGAIGASMYYFVKRRDIPWNQKLMQTRVLAQGTVIGVIISLAALQGLSEYLEKQEKKNKKEKENP
ncbi:hypothetical protein HMI54_003218 [Coelomomyces lativittatus]|nr:hypothetical protein HMI54_003218 [Coelomomyces lativittatus]KAJ1509560.1 hypothetical protein HMI55_007343 [Coelomomyces lativittatus]KAJ1510852.1 hypothetical protein HMI56_006120 [Coelomomyces lativittatus]